MSRFLFHALPLVGHVNPMAAVADALLARGHEVAWAGSEAFLRPLLGADATVFPTGMRLYRGGLREQGMAATRSRWEGYIVPHARFALAAVENAAVAYRPDVLAVDQYALAGALAARRQGMPWASLATSTMELSRPYRSLPKVEAWIDGLMATLWREAELPPPPDDLRFSPHLVIAFTVAALTGPAPDAVLVGPALSERPSDPDFDWAWLDPDKAHLLVTVGTLAQDVGKDFYRRVVDAVRPLGDRLQAVVVSPEPALLDPPDHVMVVPRAPVLGLLPSMAAVVSHGGFNTVCETLTHGVPLVVAPIKDDQPINAQHVVTAGAGVRVSFARSRPEQLRSAILTVLDDPAYRLAAGRIATAFEAAGGADTAADALEALARRSRPSTVADPIGSY